MLIGYAWKVCEYEDDSLVVIIIIIVMTWWVSRGNCRCWYRCRYWIQSSWHGHLSVTTTALHSRRWFDSSRIASGNRKQDAYVEARNRRWYWTIDRLPWSDRLGSDYFQVSKIDPKVGGIGATPGIWKWWHLWWVYTPVLCIVRCFRLRLLIKLEWNAGENGRMMISDTTVLFVTELAPHRIKTRYKGV